MQFYYGGTYCKSRDFWMRTELWTKFFGTSEIRSPFYPWKPGILRQIFGRFMSINIVSATSYRDWSDLSFLNLICVRILVISEFLKKQACIPIISFLVFLFPRVLHSAIFFPFTVCFLFSPLSNAKRPLSCDQLGELFHVIPFHFHGWVDVPVQGDINACVPQDLAEAFDVKPQFNAPGRKCMTQSMIICLLNTRFL